MKFLKISSLIQKNLPSQNPLIYIHYKIIMSLRSISPEVYSEESDTAQDYTDLSTPFLKSDLSNVSDFMDHM